MDFIYIRTFLLIALHTFLEHIFYDIKIYKEIIYHTFINSQKNFETFIKRYISAA